MIKKNSCPNFNHGRINAPVCFCPTCGGLVNENIPIKSWCSKEGHAIKRRERSKYCIDCGKQLVQES